MVWASPQTKSTSRPVWKTLPPHLVHRVYDPERDEHVGDPGGRAEQRHDEQHPQEAVELAGAVERAVAVDGRVDRGLVGLRWELRKLSIKENLFTFDRV